MAYPTYIKDENDIDFGTECPVFPPNCRYKVTSVIINDRNITTLLTEDEELLCFPQLVDYFLKDHVAGMPTIYAKVKRMGIIARSCNLDQVRLMRSMGAIGPVVNRCKLITMDDFKRLYEDCLLFRGPGRRKRLPSDSSSSCTPVKISIKRPYLEEKESSDNMFSTGRKLEEEMIVNVSSPIGGNHTNYFLSGDFDKSNDNSMLSIRRSNGFSSSDDKLGFPSMIYSTFSHPTPGAVTLTQTFDNRIVSTSSPKTTLIQPINGEMSPKEASFDHQPKSESLEEGNDCAMPDGPSANDLASTRGSPNNISSASGNGPSTTPGGSSVSASSLSDQTKIPSSSGLIKATTANVIIAPTGNSTFSRFSSRPNLQGGSLGSGPRDMRQHRERLTSSETLIGNIQGLLKVTSDNVRMVERQILVDRDEFAKQFQKECEAREKAEKMITDLQRAKNILQKKIRRLKRTTRRLNNHYQAAEQRCLSLTKELQESSYASLREQNELLQSELDKERLARMDAEKKLEEARGGIQNFVHNFLAENAEANSTVMVPV